jgi:hypothetical protein
LPLEEGAALGRFLGRRIAILRRAALEDVHDIDVAALPAAGFDDLGQELTRAADEGLALAVFVRARRFAEEDDPRPRIADAEDGLLAGGRQLAAELAGFHLGVHRVE